MNARHQLAALALAVSLSACASVPDEGVATSRVATVRIQNNYSEDMTIYVSNRSGARWRLGVVLRSSRGELFITPRMLTDPVVHLVADAIGPGAVMTFPPMTVAWGSKLDVVLENNLASSSLFVF